MASSRLAIQFDTSALDGLTNMLDLLDGAALVTLSVAAVNTVAKQVHAAAIDRAVNSVNLSRAYVENALNLKLAEDGQRNPTARVVAPARNVTLSRFDAGQHSKPVTWSNDRILGMGKKFGKWPGWTQRKGDPMRGIDPDDKASGIDVTVKRGQPRDMKSAFLVPLKNSGGRMGVFVHDGKKLKHLYGPAVYQLYRNYLGDHAQDIQSDLETELMAGLDAAIAKATP